MAVNRKPIDFDPGRAVDSLSGGGCMVPMGLFYLVGAVAAVRGLFTDMGSFLGWVGIFVLCAPIAYLAFVVSAQMISEGLEGLKKNKKWRRETTVMETSIVDRQEIEREGDDYTNPYSVYYLSLSLVPDQQAVCPGETVVIASVSRSIYDKYAHKQSARIYYYPADPLVFLIKGEI